MFDCGLIRNLVTNVPTLPWEVPVIAPEKASLRIVDCIPEKKCDYSEDRMDFTQYFRLQRGCRCILDWTKVVEDARPYVKCFSLDNLDGGNKITTETSKILLLRKVLSAAEDNCKSHSFFGLVTDDLITAIETIWPKSMSMQQWAYAVTIEFMDFMNDKTNIRLAVNIMKLEQNRTFLSDILSGYDGEKGAPMITDEHLDALIEGFDRTMRDTTINASDRMTAGICLLNTQLGLRNSEIPAIKIDCLHSIEGNDGVVDDYIIYNSIKAARCGRESIEVKTICTPLAKETVKYLLTLRQNIRGWENNEYLYIQDNADCRAGLVYKSDLFRNHYKFIMGKYMRDITDRDWPNIKRMSVYKMLKSHGNIEWAKQELTIPQIHSYRVTFACQLYAKHVNVDFINAIKEARKAKNDFEISSKLTEIMLLTNIAVMSQQINVTLEYDAANMKITNVPEANDLFKSEYRSGWSLA